MVEPYAGLLHVFVCEQRPSQQTSVAVWVLSRHVRLAQRIYNPAETATQQETGTHNIG